MSVEVMRPSHSQNVPQVGRPQSEPVNSAKRGEHGAERGGGFRGDVGERMPPDQRAERRHEHHAIDELAEPGVGHVDVHDAHGVAHLVVGGRSEEGEIKPDGEAAAP